MTTDISTLRAAADTMGGRAGELLQAAVHHLVQSESALRHIMAVCDASRSSTRRIRWIRERAAAATEARAWREDLLDLPKINPDSAEREKRRRQQAERECEGLRADATRYRKLRNMPLDAGHPGVCLKADPADIWHAQRLRGAELDEFLDQL